MMSRRMRVLLLADLCNPDWPSLPVVGFKACRAIGDHVDAVVATHVRNRAAIERTGMGRCEVAYLDNEYIAAPLNRLSRFLRGGDSVAWTTNAAVGYPSYLAFEREAWKRFGAELRSGGFDLVHRVTPMSPTQPSPMAGWSPVPFVIGPLNGGLRWPREFAAELSREREWLTFLRGAHRYLPYRRSTMRRSAAILASFRHTIEDLPASSLGRVVEFPEVGIDPEVFGAPPDRPSDGELTLLFVGRLVPYKCADVAVAAFASAPSLRRHRLRIVGDGPERPRLEAMVREHGLEARVEFSGALKQAEVGRAMAEAHVFVFPSIRELGAGVVIEAMACGMACVVVDYGAPGRLVDPSRGVRVPLGAKDRLVEGFARELEALVDDPARVERLGAAAREYALAHYTWDAKARKTVEIYRWVLGEQAEKPVFDDVPSPQGV